MRSNAAMALTIVSSLTGAASPGKAARKARHVVRTAREPRHDLALAALQPELDRMLVEHRHGHLRFERAQRGIGPAKRRVVRDVGERHRAARVQRPGRSDGPRAAVRERMRLLMTGRARERLVARQARVVEQPPAQDTLATVIGLSAGTFGTGRPAGSVQVNGAGGVACARRFFGARARR